MFGIVLDLKLDAERIGNRRHDRADQAIAAPGNRLFLVIDSDLAGEYPGAVGRLAFFVIQQLEVLRRAEVVGLLEHGPNVLGKQFAAHFVGEFLDVFGKVRLHLLRDFQALVLFQHPGEPTLAGLRVDPDHRFVIAAQVGRVDRQVGHFPGFVVLLLARGKTLLDRVLMAAGEGGVDQFAHVRMARVDRQLVAVFHRFGDGVDVREIQFRINTLRVHVQRDCDDITVARPLTIAEQAALNPVPTGHQAQFAGGNAGAAVIMGVQADHHLVAVRD